jgi:hypothetical protein
MPDVSNWFGDVTFHPQAVVAVKSSGGIVTAPRTPMRYPSALDDRLPTFAGGRRQHDPGHRLRTGYSPGLLA